MTRSDLDLVTIRNLRAWTLIGVHPHERETRQEVRIDAWLGTDASAAASSDDLERAIDYSAVARAFREHAGGASHRLVETLAEELASIALERFGALAVRIAIEKPGAVPGADAVGIDIERPRPEASDGQRGGRAPR
ncbi:MAG: dihydroneopterin aldolase [Planctomycetota bacterium]